MHLVESRPRVSVVLIFLDEERFLEEAIRSVLDQSYDRWELLLVDDGSTDGSTGIARRYAARYPSRIRYIEHENHRNKGMSASRNAGVRHARGSYVALLDADDVWFPHKLEEQVAIMDRMGEAGMVCGASEYWYTWSVDPEATDEIVPVGGPQNALAYPPALLSILYPLGSGPSPCPSSLLIRRTLFEQVGGFEEQFGGIYQLYEDQAFLSKIYATAPVYVSSRCWDRYRRHSESCVATVTAGGHYHTIRCYFLHWLEKYLKARGMEGTDAWRSLRKALWSYRHPRLAALRKQSPARLVKRTLRQALPASVYRWMRTRWKPVP